MNSTSGTVTPEHSPEPAPETATATDEERARRWLRHAEALYSRNPVAAASAAHIGNGYARLAQAAAGLPFDPADSHEPPAPTFNGHH